MTFSSKRDIRIAVAFILLAFCSAASWQPVSAQEQPPIRVAVFQGEGVGASVNDLLATLRESGNGHLEISRINGEAIRNGELSDVDVLVHPGGSGSRQAKNLGEQGRQAVAKFVEQGGGYLGVCAGGYLATNDYS